MSILSSLWKISVLEIYKCETWVREYLQVKKKKDILYLKLK